MQLNLNADDIDKYVKDVLLECTVGKNIKESIESYIKEKVNGYQNPLKGMVEKYLNEMFRSYMETPEIKAMVQAEFAKCLLPEHIQTVVTYGFDELKKRLDRDY